MGGFMGHIERKLREKEEIRQSILNAAKDIAAKEGWQAVTIRRIADKIEYTPPIVYEHFENKKDLYKELIYMGFGLIKKELDKIPQSERNARKFLRTYSLILWDFASSNTELYQLMFSLERPIPSAEMIYNLELLKSAFMELANNDGALAEELFFYWICLTFGAITVTIQLPPPPHLQNIDQRELYAKTIERFISSV
jgi:AcrR family transcriptional regulator